jgi:hypothetical protein
VRRSTSKSGYRRPAPTLTCLALCCVDASVASRTYFFAHTSLQGYTDKAAVADESKGVLLGEYRYDIYGTQVQTFAVQPDAQLDAEQSFSVVKLAVSSNYGHEDFTCVYRFRVHGDAV